MNLVDETQSYEFGRICSNAAVDKRLGAGGGAGENMSAPPRLLGSLS
jgi:hypothetical protein